MAERKRELIDTGNDKRFVRRDAEGKFKDVVDVGASLAADQRQHSEPRSSPAKATKATGKLGRRDQTRLAALAVSFQ